MIDKRLESIDEKLKILDRGLEGGSFDKFNAAWIEKYLKCLYPNADIQFNKMFKDKNEMVSQTNEIFEVDVFVEKPLIIAEATSFFTEADLPKLEKLFKIKRFFKKEHGTEVDETYFFTNDIQDSLENKVRLFCTENEIHFVKEKDL